MDTPGGFSNLTVAGCTTACGSAGYTYAGVEYAGEVSKALDKVIGIKLGADRAAVLLRHFRCQGLTET